MKVRKLIELLSQYDPEMDVDGWHAGPLDLYAVVPTTGVKAALMKGAWFPNEQQRQNYIQNVDAYIDPTEQQVYLLMSMYG